MTAPTATGPTAARPLTALSDDEIRAALADSPVAPLLPAVAELTGDRSILRDDLRGDPSNVFEPEGGLTEAQCAEARELAVGALARHRDAGAVAAPAPVGPELLELMRFVIGDDDGERYYELLREELAPGGADLRAPDWRLDEVAPGRALHVVVIGAGMSGILCAHRLRQAGVEVTVIEKNDDVGGTWFENTYPGARVDVPNHLYSYSFRPKAWPQHFSTQPELLGYFRDCAEEFGVLACTRFGTEVLEARFDETTVAWTVRVRRPDGLEEDVAADAVVSAVGQLNRPSFPSIEGRDDFAGVAFHSARWRHDVTLAGRRVAVIGTGASAAQFIPVVAEDAAALTVFQRTPNWLVPSPEYTDDLPLGMRWLERNVAPYDRWYRMWLFWRTHEGLLPTAVVDPDWTGFPASVSESNDVVRQLLTAYLAEEFKATPEMLDAVVPSYPPIAKRIIRDDGAWARVLQRDTVTLETAAIERITPTGIRTVDGVDHEVGVIIYGTGFEASKFLMPMRVVGRDGVDLHERWKGDARAYLGLTVPDFPNLFCLYGPNTNIVINGSIIYFSECEVRYVVESMRLLAEGGHRAMAVRAEVHDEFNDTVDAANRLMAWGASDVNSWYKNATGRVAQNWPFSLLEYWERTRTPDPADYDLL